MGKGDRGLWVWQALLVAELVAELAAESFLSWSGPETSL